MIEGDAEAPGALRERHLELHALLIQRHHARLCGLPEMAVGFGIPEVGVRIKLIHVLDQRACGLRGKRRVFHGRFLSLALEVSSWLASSLVRRAEPFYDRDYLAARTHGHNLNKHLAASIVWFCQADSELSIPSDAMTQHRLTCNGRGHAAAHTGRCARLKKGRIWAKHGAWRP